MALTIIPSSPPTKNESGPRDKLLSAHKAVRAVNILFFLGFAFITFREVYLCFEKYVSFPKYTTLKFVSQREVDFPSLSFCPNIMSRFKPDALQKHGINADEYNDRFWYDAGKPMHFSSRKENISDQQLFDEISYSFEELVEVIEIRHFEGDPTKGKTPNTFLKPSDKSFNWSMIREQRTYLKGKCFTFSPDVAIKRKGISLVSITLRRDVILHFAAKDQFMDMASMVILRAFTKETIRSKVDYEQFEELQDIDYTGDRTGTKGRKTCSNELFDTCMDNALVDTMRRVTEDNCTIPIVMDNSKICRKPQDIKNAFLVARTRMLNEAKDCDFSCKTLLVTIGGKTNYGKPPPKKSKKNGKSNVSKRTNKEKNQENTSRNSTLITEEIGGSETVKASKLSKGEKDKHNVILFFAPKVKKIKEHQLYSLLNLVAEAGGFVGLFLGYSFFNVILVATDAVAVRIQTAMEKHKIKTAEEEAHEKWTQMIQHLVKKEIDENKIVLKKSTK